MNDTILLVEDTDSDAELVEHVLRKANVANPIRRIAHGSEALAYLLAAESDPPAILLLDLKLPGLSGFEILAATQNSPTLSRMLRVVLSQIEDTASLKQAYARGANSFLSKPLGQLELNHLIVAYPDR